MFGERLRVAKARAKKTFAEIGAECGVTPQAVKKWENGRSMPSSAALVKLCEMLDCSLEWFMCPDPLDFRSTDSAPEGRHAKYWVREAIAELREAGYLART